MKLQFKSNLVTTSHRLLIYTLPDSAWISWVLVMMDLLHNPHSAVPPISSLPFLSDINANTDVSENRPTKSCNKLFVCPCIQPTVVTVVQQVGRLVGRSLARSSPHALVEPLQQRLISDGGHRPSRSSIGNCSVDFLLIRQMYKPLHYEGS